MGDRMVRYLNRRALEMVRLTGCRFIVAKKFVFDTVGDARCIPDEELAGIVEEVVELDRDYEEFMRKMSGT